MTEKTRLMHALFGHAEREHRNIKFFRGVSDDISVESLCAEAANGIEQIMTGLVEPVLPRDSVDVGYRERSLREIVASL
jgi:hypothetical protein